MNCEKVMPYGGCEHPQDAIKRGNTIYIQSSFKPYYSESHNVQINTPSDHKRFVKQYGPVLGDCLKQRERMAFTRKNREDIIHERYKKVGLKYPKGEKVRLDEKNMRFIPAHTYTGGSGG